MGDGKRLKEIIDSKGTNVRQVAKATGICPTTLYTIIKKDSNIRFDSALILANELGIDVNEICSTNSFSGTTHDEEEYSTLLDELYGKQYNCRIRNYLKNSVLPLLELFGGSNMPDVNQLLTSFYQLDDEVRKEVIDTIQLKLQYHRDPERSENIKNIKGWK